ncbi:MAG TPA: LysE/ArgO family amino acid transporter [Microlunatus sp.]|nr:LysE/ArgO family amino acid transporter [Microlunatus sp.]
MVDASLAGLLTGLSLIAAIGAQNAFLLRQGIRRRHVGLVVGICIGSDAILITAGVCGLGLLLQRAPWLITLLTGVGVAFLTAYGLSSAWRAVRPSGGLHARGPVTDGPVAVARKTLALTWFNPHVYLDTVLLLGSVAAVYGGSGRWWFAGGAVAASTVWFAALGLGARLLAPALSGPRTWRILDLLVAVTMIGIAIRLALG